LKRKGGDNVVCTRPVLYAYPAPVIRASKTNAGIAKPVYQITSNVDVMLQLGFVSRSPR
jgi:hypothetical protein